MIYVRLLLDFSLWQGKARHEAWRPSALFTLSIVVAVRVHFSTAIYFQAERAFCYRLFPSFSLTEKHQTQLPSCSREWKSAQHYQTICYLALWQISMWVKYISSTCFSFIHIISASCTVFKAHILLLCTSISLQDWSKPDLHHSGWFVSSGGFHFTEHDLLCVMWISAGSSLMSFFLCWQNYIGVIPQHRMVHPHLSHGYVQRDPRIWNDQRHLLQVSLLFNFCLYIYTKRKASGIALI